MFKMFHHFIIATLVMALFGLTYGQESVDTGAVSPCAATCVNNVFSNGGGIGCDQNDILCVCKNPVAFNDGIRDCVMQACVGPLGESPDQVGYAQQHGSLVCAVTDASSSSITTAWFDSTQSPEPQATETQTTEAQTTEAQTTEVQTTDSSLTTSAVESESTPAAAVSPLSVSGPSQSTTAASAGETETPATEPVPSSITSSIAIDSLSTTPSASTPTSDEQSPVSTSELPASSRTTLSTATLSATSSKSSTSDASSTLAAADEAQESRQPSTDEGMPREKKIPIIVGCSVAGVLFILLFIGVYCLSKMRLRKTGRRTLNISEPLSGSGRYAAAETYISEPKNVVSTFPTVYTPQRPSPASTNSNGARGSYESELTREARRYEDMMPSAQPRMMI